MNKDQKLLEEAYESIRESTRKPLYLGIEKDKERWMKWLSKLKHKVHEDGSVSVNKDVELSSKRMHGRLPFNFNQIQGDFVCIASDLKTLEGAPRYVAGSFSCAHNNITSLKGAPYYVGYEFNCYCCKITSLEGAPEFIGGEFSSDQFSDEDYRAFVKNRKYVEGKLDKDLNVDLGDFS